jgi:hypothetical protein
MDEIVQKISNEKDENVVQFNVTNTTANPILLNLFNTSDLSVIPNTPTYLNPPNSVTGNIGITAPMDYIVLANNGLIYASDGGTTILVINPTTNSVVAFIPLGADFTGWLTYNPINNTLYNMSTSTNSVICIDCNTNTIVSNIVVASPNQSAFNSQQNTLYVSTSTNVVVIDCNTNTIITTIPVASIQIVYNNSSDNLIYTTTSASNDISIIDCASNTLIGVLTFNLPTTMFYVDTTSTLYFANNSGTELGILNCTTNTLISSTPTPVITGILGFASLDTNSDNLYFGTSLGYSIIVSTTSNTIINSVFIALSTIVTSVFLNTTNEIYFASPLLQTLTILTTAGVTASPYYISGSTNYNAFVNNLNSEPVFIQMIRILAQNLTQLNNQVQYTKIDSNGNQIFFGEFPINKIDIEQNNNIAELKLNDLVFDGRTYINQYQLNAFEAVSVEIYYKQLDSTNPSATYPIFFKPKVALKDYIKKELNL